MHGQQNIKKSTPTCFGSQRIHHQGTFYSAWLKLNKSGSIVSVDMDEVCVMAAYCNPMCVCVCVVHCLERHPRLDV